MSIATMTGRWSDRKSGLGGGPGDQPQPFEELTGFIPVEAITLFVAAVSVLSAAAPGDAAVPVPGLIAAFDIWSLYLLFALVVTPAIVVLVAAGKWNKARKEGASAPFRWPVWPLIAAVVAFLAWAWAVPGLADSDFEKILAAFAATLVSKLLSLVDGVVA